MPPIALRTAVSGEYVPDADIDENGCVNVLDALMIMQAAAGRSELYAPYPHRPDIRPIFQRSSRKRHTASLFVQSPSKH